MFRILSLGSNDCKSLGRAVDDVSQNTTLGRQLPLGAAQLPGAFEVDGGRCAP